eukprot:SAG11_NODE_33963_length_274_cov_1.074286_1_plen_47_part_01
MHAGTPLFAPQLGTAPPHGGLGSSKEPWDETNLGGGGCGAGQRGSSV